MTEWTHPNLIGSKDTRYSRVTFTLLENQISIFENDVLIYETESVDAEDLVHLSIIQSDNPKSVLLLGGGFDGSIDELLKLNGNRQTT